MNTAAETLSPQALAEEAAAIERSRRVPGGLVLSWRQFLFWATFFRRTWRGTVVSAILGPVMYLTAMGVGLGTLVDQNHDLPGGASYVSFIAPGVLAATAMQNGFFEGAFPILGSLKWNGGFWAAVNTPQRPQDVMLGTAMQGLARSAGLCTVFFCSMLGFGTVHSAWGVLALPVAVLTGAVFLFAMMAFTVTLDSDQPINVVLRFVMMPMFLFSTTFFPLGVYPRWLQLFVEATPLYQGIEIIRGLMLGVVEPGLLLRALYLAVMALAGLTVAARRFGRLLTS